MVVDKHPVPEAWVKIPSSEELMANVPADRDGPVHPYDFGFMPGMARLIMAHGRIGAKFAPLFGEIMFSEEGVLSRAEREMVASVAAAGQDCHY